MPQTRVTTSMSADDLCQHLTALVSDDEHWMVQAQSPGSLVMRREKHMAWWKVLLMVIFVFFTLGFGLILVPLLFIGYKQQQISITTRAAAGKTEANITYTPGAKKVVNSLMTSVPAL